MIMAVIRMKTTGMVVIRTIWYGLSVPESFISVLSCSTFKVLFGEAGAVGLVDDVTCVVVVCEAGSTCVVVVSEAGSTRVVVVCEAGSVGGTGLSAHAQG